MHSFALNYIGNIRFSEKIEKINGAASNRLNEPRERDDKLQLQHHSRGSAPTMPSSSRAARVQPVHCPSMAAPPLLFSLTPSLAQLAPSSALLPRVQCVANLPMCAFTRAAGHAQNTSTGAPAPCRCRLPGASATSLATVARLRVVPFPNSLRRVCARLRAHPRAPACPLLSSCTSTMRVPLYVRSNGAPADSLPAQPRSAASTLLMRIFPRAAPAALPRTRPGGSTGLRHSMRARPYAIGDLPPFSPCRPCAAVHAAPSLLILICMLSRACPRAPPKLLRASMPRPGAPARPPDHLFVLLCSTRLVLSLALLSCGRMHLSHARPA
jgi:hypothetical protein